MRKAHLVSWLSEKELIAWLRNAKTKAEHQKRIAIWMSHLSYPVTEIATVLGVSAPSVSRWINAYNTHGPETPHAGQWGGRRWAFLPVEQEQALVDRLMKHAQKDRNLVIKQLHDHVNEAVGRKVSLNYVYELLRRHTGKRDEPQKTEGKKTLSKRWHENHENTKMADGFSS